MKSALLCLLALSTALFLYNASAAVSGPPILPAVTAVGPTPLAEVARIQAHLETVERELLARDVSELTAEQRVARESHIRVLREYREGGIFPHNHDFPGKTVPYFVDEHGTLCAMAYLISRSGREDLVERIAGSHNNARIPEMAADAELVSWLQAAGLSLDEAARIQPAYGDCCWIEPSDEPNGVSAGYAVASVLTSGVGGMSVGMNLRSGESDRQSRWPGVLGITAGAIGVGLGIDRIDDGGAPAALGAVNAAIGAVATAVGAWNLFRLPPDRAEDATAAEPAAVGASMTAAAWVPADSRGALGLRLRLRF